MQGSAALDGLEIAWLRDPFECYIAQVQGSARVNLPDGRQLCLGYVNKKMSQIKKKMEKKVAEDKKNRAKRANKLK